MKKEQIVLKAAAIIGIPAFFVVCLSGCESCDSDLAWHNGGWSASYSSGSATRAPALMSSMGNSVAHSRAKLGINAFGGTDACYGNGNRYLSQAGDRYLSRSGNFISSGWMPYSSKGVGRLANDHFAGQVERDFSDVFTTPLSTFSLDVDTASYGLLRRWIEKSGMIPDKDSVRIEEYVNSFAYDYADPTGKCPIAVACEMSDCPWKNGNQLLRVSVQARRQDAKVRPAGNFVFLIDVSGSMNGFDRIELVKQGILSMSEQLREDDLVSIVTYADDVRTVLSCVSGTKKSEIKRAVIRLSADGCTNGEGGIQRAYEEAMKGFRPKANNRVILLTDGDFNVGISDPEELKRFIAEKRKSGVYLSVFGVGEGNLRDDMMKELSMSGNGSYAYLGGVRDVEKQFGKELGGAIQTVAKDVKLQLEFNPQTVARYRLLGYGCRELADRDFKDDEKDAGEMGAGRSMTAFYEIVPMATGLKYRRKTEVGSDDVLTIGVRYKNPDEDVSREMVSSFSGRDVFRTTPSTDFRFASAVAEFALVLSDSKYRGNASLGSVVVRAESALGADKDGERSEFVSLVKKAKSIRDNEAPSGSAWYDSNAMQWH